MTALEIDLNDLARDVADVIAPPDHARLRFLARGEYSLNYLLESSVQPLVVRLVTGSQIGLSLPDQVRYEARALELLEPSGRTPRLAGVQPEPTRASFPFLVESYLPGRPLDYATDLESAARCVAAIHQTPMPPDHGLQVYADPGPSIVMESRTWAEPYLRWGDGPATSQAALLQAFAIVEADFSRTAEIFAEPDLAIVNYDLNTHNFVTRPDDGFVSLLDWEKARVAPAVQDLAHFLLPTTTLWRAATSTRLTRGQEERFINSYLAERPHLHRTTFLAQLTQMQRLIALRAVSWCSWAIWSSAHESRVIANAETLERSASYLEPAFLRELFGHGSSTTSDQAMGLAF